MHLYFSNASFLLIFAKRHLRYQHVKPCIRSVQTGILGRRTVYRPLKTFLIHGYVEMHGLTCRFRKCRLAKINNKHAFQKYRCIAPSETLVFPLFQSSRKTDGVPTLPANSQKIFLQNKSFGGGYATVLSKCNFILVRACSYYKQRDKREGKQQRGNSSDSCYQVKVHNLPSKFLFDV